MKMSQTDIRDYPKLAYYVRVNLPEAIHISAIVHAFKKIGGRNGNGVCYGKDKRRAVWRFRSFLIKIKRRFAYRRTRKL
jgi:hypothetical protein